MKNFHEENIALCRAIMAGDESGKEKILKHNNVFIKSIFRRRFYGCNFSEQEDYLQTGRLALLKAVKKYDENHESGAQFSTYAYKYIYFHMLGLYLKQRQDISLDIESVGGGLTLGECLPVYDDRFDRIFNPPDCSLFEAMRPFVEQLPELDGQIITLKYFHSHKNYSDEELAKFFHLSKVCFVERTEAACSKLKELIKNQHFIKKYLKQDAPQDED